MEPIYYPSHNPIITEYAGTRGGTHTGIDLAANLNDPVLAPFAGQIVYAGGDGARAPIWLGSGWLYPNGEGLTVDIRRADGLIARLGHLNGFAVQQGDWVTAGQTIGYAGTTGYSTGVHIHWELRWDRAWVGGNWIDPISVSPQTYAPAEPTPPPPPPIKKGLKMKLVWDTTGTGYLVTEDGIYPLPSAQVYKYFYRLINSDQAKIPFGAPPQVKDSKDGAPDTFYASELAVVNNILRLTAASAMTGVKLDIVKQQKAISDALGKKFDQNTELKASELAAALDKATATIIAAMKRDQI